MGQQNIHGHIVFLSPHLDDAVVSCGGTISCLERIGVPVEVVTIFAGSPSGELSPFAEWMHRAWRLPYDAPACRRDENGQALSSLGARSTCLSFQDSIYRRRRRGESFLHTSKEQIFSGNWQQESSLLSALVEELQQRLAELSWAVLCTPLGAGGHVDHLLAHVAAERVCAGLKREEIVFYEDLPYALDLSTLQKALTRFKLPTDLHLVVPLTEPDMCAKGRAIRLYTSQSKDIAGELGILVHEVLGYAYLAADKGATGPGERFWASRRAALEPLRRALNMR